MTEATHAALKVWARRALLMERMATAVSNQAYAMREAGVPEVALSADLSVRDLSEAEMADLRQAKMLITRIANRMKRECSKLCKDEPVRAFVDGTLGLSHATFVFLGCMPPLTAFANPAKLWKWCGLAPGQRRKKGQRANFSPQMKAHATMRLALPCIKQRRSPYRDLYDARRAHTAETHPEWTDGHSHNDARRYVAKAILKDLWRVENGQEPVVGANPSVSPPRVPAPTADSNEQEAA